MRKVRRMARLRTDEEKIAILEHCLDLERSGGDILGYLWSQDYLTPRATWFNFQREWLGRKPYQYTDGKPKQKEMKTVNKKTDKRKVLEAVVEAIERGDNPLNFLLNFGYKAPMAAYSDLKKYAAQNAPEMLSKLPDLRTTKKAAPKTVSAEQIKKAASIPADAVVIEAPQFKVNNFAVTAVRNPVFGEFYHDGDHDCIDWRTPGGDEMSLKVGTWKDLIRDLPTIMMLLGVEV